MYGCPVRGCDQRRKRRTDMNRHMRTHPIFKNEVEVRQYNAKGPMVAEVVDNTSWINPGKTQALVPVTVKQPPSGAVPFRLKERASRGLATWARERKSSTNSSEGTPKAQVKSVVVAPGLTSVSDTRTVTINTATSVPMETSTPVVVAGPNASPHSGEAVTGHGGLKQQHDRILQELKQQEALESAARARKEAAKKELKKIEGVLERERLAKAREAQLEAEARLKMVQTEVDTLKNQNQALRAELRAAGAAERHSTALTASTSTSLLQQDAPQEDPTVAALMKIPITRPVVLYPSLPFVQVFILSPEDIASLRLRHRVPAEPSQDL